MARLIFCRKYKEELEGLDAPPYPGAKGQDIFDNISKKAWQEWMAHQTMLINEKRLNMMDMGTRVYLRSMFPLQKCDSAINIQLTRDLISP